MKQSHLTTPRTLAECQFVPGYRPAMPRDLWAEAGHLILNAAAAVGLVGAVVLVVLGSL